MIRNAAPRAVRISIVASSDFFAGFQEQVAQPHGDKAQNNGLRDPDCKVHPEFLLFEYAFFDECSTAC